MIAAYPLAPCFLNTLVIAGSVTLLGVASSAMAAYAFARLHFPDRDALFLGYLGTLMIPVQMVIIPNFILLRTPGHDTTWTLQVDGSGLALVSVLTVFLWAQRYSLEGITLTGVGGR